MRKRLVGVGHTMGVLALLHRGAAILRRVADLARQALLHGVLGAAARRADQPADRQRLAAIGTDLDGNLIGRAADAPRANLDSGADIRQRLVKDPQRILSAAPGDAIEGAVDDGLGSRLLALVHQAIDELGDDVIAELGVRQDFALNGGTTTRHLVISYFGRLAPYFERRWPRSLTPFVSTLARTLR